MRSRNYPEALAMDSVFCSRNSPSKDRSELACCLTIQAKVRTLHDIQNKTKLRCTRVLWLANHLSIIVFQAGITDTSVSILQKSMGGGKLRVNVSSAAV